MPVVKYVSDNCYPLLTSRAFLPLADPLAMGPKKALEAIGGTLQKQYERWQPRARSKLSLDPTLEEVKKLCQSLRRNAKVLGHNFHPIFNLPDRLLQFVSQSFLVGLRDILCYIVPLRNCIETDLYYRKSVFCFTTMDMVCLNQLRMGKFGYLTK